MKLAYTLAAALLLTFVTHARADERTADPAKAAAEAKEHAEHMKEHGKAQAEKAKMKGEEKAKKAKKKGKGKVEAAK